MRLRSRAAEVATGLLSIPPVAAVGRRRSADQLRIIDYHGIDDRDAFAAQVRFLARQYRPVSESQVREALAGGRPLPRHAVWLTFDDGHPSVATVGLEVLASAGVPATLYVCPGLIEAQEPPWWELVYAAERAGEGAEVGGRWLRGAALVRALKAISDRDRRVVVDKLRTVALDHLGPEPVALTTADLDRWVDAGNEIGNHTWDHPCLHQCDGSEQAWQITAAHEWLLRYRPDRAPTFAYPNGDHTDHAESVLVGLGYDVALLSDHALVDPAASPQRTSRLRLDATAPVARARAVLSGTHSAGYRWALRHELTGPSWAGQEGT